MGKINSRDKGSKFERVIAKMFTEVYGVEFHRTPLSGGLHWKNDNNISGDIVPPANINFKYSIECKNVEESWDFDKIIEGTSKIWDWWSQAVRDAKDYKKIPVLIFKKNRKEPYVMIEASTLKCSDGINFIYNGSNYVITKFTDSVIKKLKGVK